MRKLIKKHQEGDFLVYNTPENVLQKRLEKRNRNIKANREQVEKRTNRKPMYPNIPNLPPSKKMLREDDGFKINK